MSAFLLIVLDGNSNPAKVAVHRQVPSSHGGYRVGPGLALLKTGLDRSLRSRRSERSAWASAGDGSDVVAASAKPRASARLLSTTTSSSAPSDETTSPARRP